MTVARRPPAWVIAGIGLVLLATAGFFRLYRLGEIPAGLFLDEGANGLDALRVLDGQIAPFFPANHGREGLLILLIAPFVSWLGQTAWAVRLPGALAGVAAVLVVFALGQVLFAQPTRAWRGVAVGAVAALWMAISLGQVILGRIAFRSNLLLLLLPLAVLGVWVGWQRRSWAWMTLAGIASGLAIYTYIPARLLPVFWLIWAVTLYLSRRPSRQQILDRLPHLCLYMAVSLVVALPLLIHFVLNPADFSSRSGDLWIFAQPAPWRALAQNLVDHLAVFGVSGDPNWRHNLPGRPLLSGIEAILFWVGVATCAWGWRHPARQLLLIWLIVFLLPATLALDAAPNTLRMTGMMPAVFLVVGVGAVDLGAALLWLVGQRFPARRATTIAALIVVMAGALGWNAERNAHLYFETWATAGPVLENFDVHKWLQLKTQIEADARQNVVYVAAFDNRHPPGYAQYNFEFLYQGETPVHIWRTMDESFSAQLSAALSADAARLGEIEVEVVEWTADPYADATGRLRFLLDKYGQYQGTSEFEGYRLHRYDQVSTAEAWTLYAEDARLDILYDNGLYLTAADVSGAGGVRLSGEPCVGLSSSNDLWVALRWRAEQPPPADYRISVRLHRADNSLIDQSEAPILGFDYSGTASWQSGDEGESLLHIDLPADLGPGAYHLRLVVYDQATLTPAVVTGVWTPEIELGCFVR